MEVVVFCTLLGLALLSAFLSLELDIHEFRLRLSGLMSFDQIQERTGWGKRKIEHTLGPLPESNAYRVDRETLKKLPRNVWVAGPDLPLLNLMSIGGLVWTGVRSLMTGVPDWALLGLFGGYQAVASAWDIVVIILRERSNGEDEEEDREEERHLTIPELQDTLAGAREELQREMREGAADMNHSPFWAWAFACLNRWFLRRVDRVERETAGLGEEYTRLAVQHRELITKVRWEAMRAERDGESERARALLKIESEVSRDLEEVERAMR